MDIMLLLPLELRKVIPYSGHRHGSASDPFHKISKIARVRTTYVIITAISVTHPLGRRISLRELS